MEGEDNIDRIVGSVIAPGNVQVQSPYRSELTGIYATMVIVEKLCQYYNISSGQIELACDGLSALNKAFLYVALISVDEPSYDLLATIRQKWLFSKIQWRIRHVKGHQDEDLPLEELDRWGRLNVEMDQKAKAFIQVVMQRPRHHLIKDEPWSLWYQNNKIVKDIQPSIYEIIHSSEARSYWEQEEKIVSPLFDSIHWDAVNQAMQSTKRSTRVFVSKHTVGMCGVWKFMHLWKQKSSAACPRCGEFEDASHVWKCKGAKADEVWRKALDDLEAWMESVQTDTDIQEAIINKLECWRSGTEVTYTCPFQLQPALQQQDDIGWGNFLEGWASFEWALIQQDYYDLLQSRRSGLRWLSSLIKKLCQVAWDLWEHRNGILHEQENCVSLETLSNINKRIRILHSSLISHRLPLGDRYLVDLPLQKLLAKDSTYKKAWIANADSCVTVNRKAISRSRRSLRGMKKCLWKWLKTGNKRQQ